MTTPTTCRACGAALQAETPAALCPACLTPTTPGSERDVKTVVAPAGVQMPAHKSTRPVVGRPFGGYLILRLLGEGGMGAVYEAEHLESGRRVALKVLGRALDSAEARKRFFREGRLAASVNHPNSVYVYGTEEIEETPIITMELVAGGTLQERVQKEGPFSIPRAVDAILQIIEGLEAAQALGVLHRDIKPSNCFIDADGSVKIGDFGLSVSTTARAETQVTVTGTSSPLGTPAYASPEQLRGDELDVRSDIYSVGVTLYFLLTGKVPFASDNFVKFIATVLERPPDPPDKLRPDVPKSLSRIVLRCLEKQAGARFPSYDALRQALRLYSSAAPTPATLGLRIVAGIVDQFVISLTAAIPGFFWPVDPKLLQDPEALRSVASLPIVLAGLGLRMLYYAIPECLGGASVGKAICGLRVVAIDRGAAAFRKTLLRALLFVGLGALPALAVWVHHSKSGFSAFMLATSGTLYYAILALMFSTARRRNGFAGLHDLASGTRVIQKSAVKARPHAAPGEELIAASGDTPKFGPFHVLSTLEKSEAREILLGYDVRLFRKVWICKWPAGTPAVPEGDRQLGRVGRLRWLSGRRAGGECWDAYEAAPGKPLVALLNEPQTWDSVRYWLLDLAEELRACLKCGSIPALSLDRVWIASTGRAKLLDFTAPGAAAVPPATSPKAFLRQVALSALEGRIADGSIRAPRTPIPLHARAFLEKLDDEKTFDSLVEELRLLVHRVASVTRPRRLALLVGCALLPVITSGTTALGIFFMHEAAHDHPDLKPLEHCLARHAELERKPYLTEGEKREQRALETYMAVRFQKIVSDSKLWTGVYSRTVPEEWRRTSEKLASRPMPTAEEYKEAEARVKTWLETSVREEPLDASLGSMALTVIFIMVVGWLVFVAFPALACALLFRGGLIQRLCGVAVVRRDGTPASRGRCVWRAVVTWSLMLLYPLAIAPLFTLSQLALLACVPAFLFAGGAALSLATPGRSLQDRVAGTCLVPR